MSATSQASTRRKKFEALAFASDACPDLAQRVEAERRCDTLVDAPSLNMLADGRRVAPGPDCARGNPAVFTWQRRQARSQRIRGQCGSVTWVQRFGGHLNLNGCGTCLR